MARVFISHSSRDKEPAARIMGWLHTQGFETPFLDFDKHAGIPPGADWEKTLYREIERSEAVIVIQTPNWLESKWCFAEFTQARALGKAIFPVIEAPTGDTLISPDIQALDLQKDEQGGLERLARELTQIALDAQGGFAFDPHRPPFPGLLAFQEEDAALYFGRDDDIRRLIERLNARRAHGGAKLVALLGSSGSGKSSLMRAGVIPRLKRTGRTWIVLPPMRPQRRPVDELAQCLAVACGGDADWRKLRDELNGENVGPMVSDIAHDLRTKVAANEAEILLPIDQGEELFGVAEPDQAQRFFDILNETLSDDQPFLGVMAMRSDYLGKLQSADRLKVRFEEFSLGPMPLARIPQIIEGPARVAGLRVEDGFAQQAVRDAETVDALPLLAFALRELYDRGSGDHYLSLAAYNALGDAEAKLTPLENSVRKAADDVLAEAKPSDEEMAALRDAFVPAMVRVNDQGEYVRRPAKWDNLPPKSHALLERLAKARLLIVSQQGDDRIVEVAHEALLRKWPRLRAWLDEAREFLAGKQQLEVDLRDWERASEADKADALLSGLKLHRAREWLTARPQQFSDQERAYIRASIDQAEAVQLRKLRQRRIITWASVTAAVVLACVAVFAGLQWRAAENAFQTRASEFTRFAWEDLGAKQAEVSRLTTLARQFNQNPDLFIFNPVSDTDPNAQKGHHGKLQPDSFDCSTWLTQGFRYLYCSIRSVINFEKVRSMARLNVFQDGGPHTKEVSLDDPYRFGHYNSGFLAWLDNYIVPQGLSDARFNALARGVYKAHIGPVAHALYHSHEILLADPETSQAFAERYDIVRKDYRKKLERRDVYEGLFDGDLNSFEKVKSEYQQRLAQRTDPKDGLGEAFRWLSDYQAVDMGDDWYLANTAGGFWVRRSIDGTDDQIFRLLTKLLQTFEPTVLAAAQFERGKLYDASGATAKRDAYYNAALVAYTDAVSRAKSSGGAPEALAAALLGRAEVYGAMGDAAKRAADFNDAAAAYTQAIASTPKADDETHAALLFERGKVYGVAGDTARRGADFQEAQRLGKAQWLAVDVAKYFESQGELALSDGQYERATENYSDAIAAAGDKTSGTQLSLAQALFKRGTYYVDRFRYADRICLGGTPCTKAKNDLAGSKVRAAAISDLTLAGQIGFNSGEVANWMKLVR